MKMFASDNCSGVHEKILDALIQANDGHAFPYGNDSYSLRVEERFQALFQAPVQVHLLANGTGANVVGLSSLLMPYQGVICSEMGHINTDECGAFERITGSKIIPVGHDNGKIKIEAIKKKLVLKAGLHHVQPKVISISQTTEYASAYTNAEIKALADFAHAHDLYLHVDGARLSNALVAQETSLKEMFTDTGVDLLSFGGTKNGMMFGEAIIALTEASKIHLPFLQKQGMQLISKQRFIAAQFLALLKDDLYLDNARHANDMAKILARALQGLGSVSLKAPVESNMVFAYMPKAWISKLQDLHYFYLIDEATNLVRFVTSFDTKPQEIHDLVEAIKVISLGEDL